MRIDINALFFLKYFVFASILTAVMMASPVLAVPLQVKTQQGAIEGYIDKETQAMVWRGIPYAAPPVSDRRWKAPIDAQPWSEIRATKDYAQRCLQYQSTPIWVALKSKTGSEDCLYLNITRPNTDDNNLPVYFWIHGGANVFGRAAIYGVEALAKRFNVVVVTVAYRLGPLGYFSHPALRTDNKLDSSGNYGLLDIIKGLTWTRDNIESFGGNPNNITISGESAGASNVMALMTSPLAKGLFHKAIAQSVGAGVEPMAKAEARADRTIQNLLLQDGIRQDKVMDMAKHQLPASYLSSYLRSKPAEVIIDAFSGDRFESVDGANALIVMHIIDQVVLADSYSAVIASGDYHQVPIIIGTNEREMGPISLIHHAISDGDPEYRDLWAVLNGKRSLDSVLKTPAQKAILENIQNHGSRMWTAGLNHQLSQKLTDHQDNIYSYRFAFGERSGVIPETARYLLGAGHAMELPFVWGWGFGLFGYAFTDENRSGREALQAVMMDYWQQFMHTGNPNKPDLPTWAPWSNENSGSKSIILDASKHKVMIAMSTEEFTLDAVREDIEKLPDSIRRNVKKAMLWPNAGLYNY